MDTFIHSGPACGGKLDNVPNEIDSKYVTRHYALYSEKEMVVGMLLRKMLSVTNATMFAIHIVALVIYIQKKKKKKKTTSTVKR